MHYDWNGTHTIEGGERVGVLFWNILPPVYLLTPNSAAAPGQHVWYAQPAQVTKAANLSLFKARWTCSVFHSYYLSAVLVPSSGLEEVIAHIEALAKFTQQDLNDSKQSLPLIGH